MCCQWSCSWGWGWWACYSKLCQLSPGVLDHAVSIINPGCLLPVTGLCDLATTSNLCDREQETPAVGWAGQ